MRHVKDDPRAQLRRPFQTFNNPVFLAANKKMDADVRRKLDELAVRWKMKDPGRADETTEYSRVPLMNSQADDVDDQVRCFLD